MIATTASKLAARAFDGAAAPLRDVDPETRCAACGGSCDGRAHAFVPQKSFNDVALFARPGGRDVCESCSVLLFNADATAGHSGSGVVSAMGFTRLLSNRERLAFLTAPPEPPFAVALITAKRQHVWWMARVAYDRDVIPLQFGHRALIVDRPRAVSAADAVLEYEQDTLIASAQDKAVKPTYVFTQLSRDLKTSQDGQYTARFQVDQGNHAKALKAQLAQLTLGDLWAMSQLRAAARELKAPTVAAAVLALEIERDTALAA